MDIPRRSRSNGRHGSGSSSLSALKPMKQMRVSASTPPTSATSTTPSRIRSAPSAMEAAPDAHAITSVSRGPSRPKRKATASACARGKTERRAPRPGAGPRSGPPPVPRLGFVHAAAHRPDEAGCPSPISAVEPRVDQRLGGRREREPVGSRAAPRRPEPRQHLRGHLRGHAGAQPLGLDGGDRADDAGARGQARPKALDARAVRAHAPSPLTTTRGDAARVIPPRTWTGRSAPGSRGRGTRRSGLRARRSRCRNAPRCPRTAR